MIPCRAGLGLQYKGCPTTLKTLDPKPELLLLLDILLQLSLGLHGAVVADAGDDRALGQGATTR